MRDDLDRRDTGMRSGTIMMIAAVIAVLAIALVWHPWSGPQVADNTAPGTTVGSTTRPAAPVAPTSPAPVTPGTPSTNR